MPPEREKLEQELLEQASKAIKKMLDELPEVDDITLSDMEQATGVMGRSIMQQSLQKLAQEKQPEQAEVVHCQACGEKMHRRGKRKKRVESLRGEIEIERPYLVCPNCGETHFPLDEQWKLNQSVYSHEMAARMVWLGALLPYQQCQAVLERIGERYLPSTSIWRQVQIHGKRLEDYVQQEREQVRVERVVLPDMRHDHDEEKVVSMDGGFANIRGQGWRELKVGAVSDIEIRLERNPKSQELEQMAHGVNVHYTAVLGSKDAFTPALWALAVEQQVPTARKRASVGDGALWVWNVAEDVCPDGRQIVDWFHAVEHLSQAAHALYPDEKDEKKRKRWLKTYKDHLYMGRIHKIISVLTKRDHPELATYFDRHQRRMQYHQFREEGLPIGSGTVESGVKQFKQRLCGTGMRWEEDNANQMLVIRAAVLSNQFDALWKNAPLH